MRANELRATGYGPRAMSGGFHRRLPARSAKLAARNRGFTLIEMIIVISMILVLLAVALPMYNQSITRAREATLKENLHTLNKLIDQYSLDKKKAPQSLDDLVQAGYLKYIPNDITGKPDTWKTEQEDPQNSMDPNQPGIVGVKSGSEATSSEGTPYSSW
jgi:general secretion pathway protein G